MKRALLIAGGTLGGLGAVMAITPPHLGSTSGLAINNSSLGSASAAPAPSTASATPQTKNPTTAPTQATATKKATAKAAAPSTAATKTATATTNPTPAQTVATKGVNGTFVGPAIFVNYGTVQVEVTVKDGKITDATALQAPTGRSARYTSMAVPILKQQTLAAQSASIQGASGASYTSYGWFKSLQGALTKAGL